MSTGGLGGFLVFILGVILGIAAGIGAARLILKKAEIPQVAKWVLAPIVFVCCLLPGAFFGFWGCAAVMSGY